MMKILRTLIHVFLIGGVFMLYSACDNASTDPQLQTGDLNDPEFEQIDGLFGEGFAEINDIMLGLTFELIDSIPGMQLVAKPSAVEAVSEFDNLEFEYSYNDDTYWHVFSVSASGSEDDGYGGTVTFSFAGADSIRFSNGVGFMQYYDETTTGIEIGWNFDVGMGAPDGEFDYISEAEINLAGVYEGDFTINGSSSDAVSIYFTGDQTTCAFLITADQEFTDLVVSSAGVGSDCPSSGRIDVAATISVECEGETPEGYQELAVNGNWDIAYIFSDGFITMQYSDGTTQWTNTEECGGEVVYSPRNPVVEI